MHDGPPCACQGARPPEKRILRGSAPGRSPPARPAAMEEGTHPDPSRTRKLSPPSPMVLRRKAVGEQDAAGRTGGLRFRGPLESERPAREGGFSAFPGEFPIAPACPAGFLLSRGSSIRGPPTRRAFCYPGGSRAGPSWVLLVPRSLRIRCLVERNLRP